MLNFKNSAHIFCGMLFIILIQTLSFGMEVFQTNSEGNEIDTLKNVKTNLSADEYDFTNEKRISFSGFPVVLYTPETSVILGGGGVITLRNEKGNYSARPNSINLHAIYTLKNQFGFSISPEFYFDDYNWKTEGRIAYQKFPDLFYGVGNVNSEEDAESYSKEEYLFSFAVMRRIYENLRFGFLYKVKRTNAPEILEGGELATGGYYGINGATLSGLGPVIDWDTRDNIFFPTGGFRLNLYARFYERLLGSDFQYALYSADFRYYFALAESHVLAVQLSGESVSGEIPFNEYSVLESMRGISANRFRDEKMFMGQIEYRFPILGRFSGATFIAVGDVANEVKDISMRNMKYSFGFGLRYSINPDEKINFRLDVGISPWGVSPYFQISEAF